MVFTPESEHLKRENLAALAAIEPIYTANEEARDQQSSKTFTALVAPFGSGKTVIGDEVIRLEPTIQLINTSTSRRRKPEDHPQFNTADEGISTSWFLEKARNGELTNFSVIPDTDVYGTLPEDFPGRYSLGPFLPSGLEQIKKGGFEHFHPVYIVTPGEMWRNFVNKSRRNLPGEKFKRRALESIDSTAYALDHPNDFIFVKNDVEGPEGISRLAKTIAAITLTHSFEDTLSPDDAKPYLENMKSVAEDLARNIQP